MVVIPLHLREGERERSCVCGCERGQNILMQSMLGPCGSNGMVASL